MTVSTPFETDARDNAAFTTASTVAPFPTAIPGSSTGQPPTDEDRRLEDLTGDGTFSFTDVIEFVFALDALRTASLTDRQVTALDQDGNGRLGFRDVIDLVFELQSR